MLNKMKTESDVDKKLDVIISKLSNVQEGIRRNDIHISFVTKAYLALRDPLLSFLEFVGFKQRELVDEAFLEEDPESLLMCRNSTLTFK
jgi:hypothetical protein